MSNDYKRPIFLLYPNYISLLKLPPFLFRFNPRSLNHSRYPSAQKTSSLTLINIIPADYETLNINQVFCRHPSNI